MNFEFNILDSHALVRHSSRTTRAGRGAALVAAFLVMSTGFVSLLGSPSPARGADASAAQIVSVDDSAPGMRLSPAAEGASLWADPAPVASAPAAAAPAPVVVDSIVAYRGMGAWVDLFDFAKPGTMSPEKIVATLAQNEVKTLYLQTARWNTPYELPDRNYLDIFIELAHASGIKVVAWYLPGFADIDHDLRRSMAAINYTTINGHRFDSFAPDIEDKRAVGNDTNRFNQGIIEYSQRLRASVPAGYALGAIVLDAKNNKRAPAAWAGFPWPEIARDYDVVLPMAYWSVVKRKQDCPASMDVPAYMREVVTEMQTLGMNKPIHLIGGIADCNSTEEIARFVDVSKEMGMIGGSIYDFYTTETNPGRDFFWADLRRLNELLPTRPTRD